MIGSIRIYIALAAALALSTAVLGGMTYVSHLKHELAAAQVGQATQTGRAVVATEQSAAQVAAAIIADRSAQRDLLLAAMNRDHADAIRSAPGAALAVDPGLNAAGRRGLCQYAAYASDPGCTGLRGHDPA